MIHIFSSTFNFLYSFTPSDRLELNHSAPLYIFPIKAKVPLFTNIYWKNGKAKESLSLIVWIERRVTYSTKLILFANTIRGGNHYIWEIRKFVFIKL